MASQTSVLCNVEEKIAQLFCKEMAYRETGKRWGALYEKGVILLNMKWMLDIPDQEDSVIEALSCYFTNHFSKAH